MQNALQRSAMLCYSVTNVLLHARECSGGDSNSKFQRSLRRYEKGSRAGAGAAHGERLDHYVRECGEQLLRRCTLWTARAFLRRSMTNKSIVHGVCGEGDSVAELGRTRGQRGCV